MWAFVQGDEDFFEVEVFDRDVGVPGGAQVVEEVFVEVVDGDQGDGAVDFVAKGAGDGEVARQVGRRRRCGGVSRGPSARRARRGRRCGRP